VRTWPALEVSRLTQVTPDGPELLQGALVDYRVAAIAESTPDIWRVFFNSTRERDRAAAALANQFQGLSIDPVDIPDEDWVARSQAQLRAVRVGNIIVAPPWDVPQPGAPGLDPAFGHPPSGEPIIIVIRPSMGFGTAHHATTRLCLEALQRLDVQGRAVVDVGTGSGVLAIAASRLGAALVAGVDDDPDALQSAADNLSLNRDAQVELHDGDVRSIGLSGFDLVMANLTGALLAAAAPTLRSLGKPGGYLVLSGLLEDEEAGVLSAYAGCVVHNRSQEGEWLCVSLQQP
jgi:ribosomal protein L11 methyltransferase